MTEQQITDKVKIMVDRKRFLHSEGVRDTAEKLARHYGVSTEKARIAGILHDCAKCIPNDEALQRCADANIKLKPVCFLEKGLIHSYLGAYIAENEFGIDDEEILTAIYYHTTGCENMSLLTKIIYLSDIIEPQRNVPNLTKLRELSYRDLDEALIKAIGSTITHVLSKGSVLDCDTVNARNYLVVEKRNKKQGKI